MIEDTNATTPQTPQPPPAIRNRALPIWGGGLLVVTLVGLLAWGVVGSTGGRTPTPGPTAQPTSPASPTTQAADTPTILPGAATFTPVPGHAVTGPHVLGITAGVGMREGDVAGAVPIAVTFSDKMDTAAAQAAFGLQPAAPGAFSWQANTLLFTPQAPLSPNTSYRVSVGTQARTSSGQPLGAPMDAAFKTAPAPAILRTLPSAGASEVPTDTIVTISFNRPMIPLTALESQPNISQWVTISPAVEGRWVWLGTSAAGFHAATGLLPSTAYSVTVKDGWPDEAGVTLARGQTFGFTTIKPAILSVSPENGSKDVPLDAPIAVEFNQPMDHDSVQRSFTPHLYERSAALQGTYSWSPDSTVMTFTPASPLEFSKAYDVLIGGPVKAVVGSETKMAGNNFWEFHTTDPTHVKDYSPAGVEGRPAEPTSEFSLLFNNPLAEGQDASAFLSVDPVPKGYKNQLALDASGIYTQGVSLLPNTTYTFTLKAGMRDKWGFPVAPSSRQVQIGPLPPSLLLKRGSTQPLYAGHPTRIQIDATNLDNLTLHLYQLSEDDMHEVLGGNLSSHYSRYSQRYPGELKREWDVPVHANANGPRSIYPTVALDAARDRLPPGYYILQATAGNPYGTEPLDSAAVLMVGRAALVTKSEGTDLLVWAADLSTGKPLPSYPVRVETKEHFGSVTIEELHIRHEHTGADGLLRIKLDKSYAVTSVWSEQPGDAAAVDASIGPRPYGPNIEQPDTQRDVVYTDRPIYRPGQTVYYRVVQRLDDDATYSLPPVGTSITLTAAAGDGQRPMALYTGTVTLSSLGTGSGHFVVPLTAPTGQYNLSNDISSTSFQVEEYRKPDFQVRVTADHDAVVHGDPVTARIATSYYFGGPLANVTTTVNLQTSPYYFDWSDPDTGESYTFGEGGIPWLENDVAYGSGPNFPPNTGDVQSYKAQTDQDGHLAVAASKYVTTTDSSKTVLIEGQVQDLSNQTVAANTNIIVHQGLYYVGLRVGDYVATAKQATTITVRTVDAGGKSVQPNTSVHLRIVRNEWTPPKGQGDWTVNEVPVAETTLTTDAAGRATYLFTPPSGGDYRVHAESTDARGNLVHSSAPFWAAAADGSPVEWRTQNQAQIKLVADKKKYNIGDTAHILVTSPFTQAIGLLTIERGHLKRYRFVNLTGGAPTLDVPLEAGDLPDVFVGLSLLGPGPVPAGAPADWGRQMSYMQGYVKLTVDASSKQLHVTVEPPGQGPFLPGSTQTVTIRTTDAAGKPAPAELSLAVVDEAIFALADNSSADLFDTFWAERGLGVSTSSSFSVVQADTIQGMPLMGGDGSPSAGQRGGDVGPPTPQTVRVNFQDTAFWRANVTTGQDGSATVPVPLPDNLTTWRLTARGITGGTLAGMTNVPLTVTKPLLLRPVQPRFLTVGDSPHPGAIIHNYSGAPLAVTASLTVSGALTLDAKPPAEQQLTIAAGAEAVVTWSGTVGQGDTANLRYWVHTAGAAGQPGYLEDAVGAQLPVEPFAAPEAVATSGEVSGTRADESVLLPYTVNPLLGELVVQVSPSLAASTVESLKYLEVYPYESTDQTVSRFMPLVVLDQVYREQGLKTPYSADLPAIVDSGVARLAALQQGDGGWSWWERGPSDWWETAYAVQGLGAARDSGYHVPDAMLQRGTDQLAQFLSTNDTSAIDATYRLNMQAYTLYVLATVTYPDHKYDLAMTSAAQDLAGQSARISNHARAWLAMALAKLSMKPESKTVLDSLTAAARQSSTTAHWEEAEPDYWSMGTDNRATALALDALVTLAPDDPLVPKAVRWLMTAEKEGHWLTTQETAISLVSLAHYMRQSKELSADYSFQVSAFDKLLGEGTANSRTLTQTTTVRLPSAGLPQNSLGDLALARDGTKGKMYYQVSLRYYVPGEGIKSRSEGLAITRSYYAMPNGTGGTAGDDPIKQVNAGDLIKVRLTIVVPETSHYVLVTDPLPAGLEGVNGSLNTTSFTERPPNPAGILAGGAPVAPELGGDVPSLDPYYRWGPFDNVEMRDDRTVLFASYMSPGTYVYDYFARATTPGVYLDLPARAELLYYPDVFGHSDGGSFTVK
ncbi:MAG: Ig-like domain-containing protein [Chloroflexia bacterium]